MKVFSKEKYLAQPSLEYLKEASLRSGWVDECDGKHVIDGRCGAVASILSGGGCFSAGA